MKLIYNMPPKSWCPNAGEVHSEYPDVSVQNLRRDEEHHPAKQGEREGHCAVKCSVTSCVMCEAFFSTDAAKSQ